MNDTNQNGSYTLVVSCSDAIGIVAEREGSLLESNHHTDVEQGWFCMRNVIGASSLR
ncbi:MAG: hypothetical protein OSA77_07165 [Halioglobus sp.]|jgi:formyltetrahydrofolate deformylase|nr:hypothetical protein [Halioglobus sp.]